MSYADNANAEVRTPLTVVKLELDNDVVLNPTGRGIIVDELDELTLRAGDTVIISSPTLPPFALTDLTFNPPVTILSDVNTVIEQPDNTQGYGALFTRCRGINLRGFDIRGGLNGVRGIDCSEITVDGNEVSGQGERPVYFTTTYDSNFDTIQVINNRLHDSGLVNGENGQAVLIGDPENLIGTIDNVRVKDNTIYNTTTDPVRCTSIVIDADLDENDIFDVFVREHGVITAAIESVASKPSAHYKVRRNNIRGVTFSPIWQGPANFIHTGNGLNEIYDNDLTNDSIHGSGLINYIGIRTNQEFTSSTKDVYIDGNAFTGFLSANEIRPNDGPGDNPCNYFFERAINQDNPNPLVCSVHNFTDPATWISGDVICVPNTELLPFALDGLEFVTRVTIWAHNGCKIEGTPENHVNNGTGSSPLYIQNGRNIRLVGFELTGETMNYGLLFENSTAVSAQECHAHHVFNTGIYGRDCSDIETSGNRVHDVGQEGIHIGPSIDRAMDLIIIRGNEVFRTGLKHPLGQAPYYGEGIYAGQGQLPNYGPMTNVIIEDNHVYETRAEGVDCKSNVKTGIIRRNRIHDIFLPYNGAITCASEAEPGHTDTVILVEDNETYNINTSGNEYNPYYHCVVGRGNITVRRNRWGGKSAGNEYGLGIFRTSVDQVSNVVYVGDNEYGDIDSENRISINESSANLPVDFPMDYQVLTSEVTPEFVFDASDTATLETTENALNSWTDSSKGYRFEAPAGFEPSVNTRSINGMPAVEFSGSQFMQILNGPQLLANSMFFVVAQADNIGASRLLSFQEHSTTKMGINLGANGWEFGHGETYTPASAAANTNPVLIAGYRNGDTIFINVGGATSTLSTGSDFRSLNKWILGALSYSSGQNQYFRGALGEIRGYNYYTTEKFNEVISELNAKWGFASTSGTNIPAYTPAAWYDASDADTIVSLGTALQQLLDKSGNDRHLVQGDSDLQLETGVDTVNGLNCITATANQFMQTGTGFLVQTCIAAFRTDGDAENEYTNLGGEYDGSPSLEIRWRSTTPQVSFDGSTLNNGEGRYVLNGGEFSGNASSNLSELGITTDTTHVLSAEYTWNVGLRRLGGREGLHHSGKSRLCEILWFDRVLSSADRYVIEKYLSDKWGGSVV